MKRYWGLIVLVTTVILLAILGTACSSKEEKSGALPEVSSTPNASVSPSKEPVKRTITHTLGSIAVAEKVERVVTLERSFADHIVSLGIVPVGAVVRDGGDFEPYIANQLKGSASVGQGTAPNMEKLLGLKPELIIGTDKEHSKAYDTLKQIAPTLIITSDEMEKDWRGVFLKIADAVNKQELAKQQLKTFDENLLALKDQLAPIMKGKTVVFFKVTDKDTRILGNLSPLGKIAYEQLGLKYPESLKDESNETKIAAEILPEINPDYIFVMDTNVPEYVDHLNEMLKTPLWKSLNAVKDGKVVMVPLRATKTGFGLVMHNQFVDTLKRELLKK
ncbi:ABC transporter substrate-binding protein [Paenibacillus koleovorans]|uniref:ABC transporter substrate-binding protein n=1 Tax=Paenibacillus koleovorans TaxID=121608 RepID=UPI000FDC79F1|nr:iron-siderophore ABC transporter substrate-binding protein [Paenibacillus koleovorans]